jgi:hypothetical protein
MQMKKNLGALTCALIALGCIANSHLALSQPGEPHYLHALSELRTARDYIQYDRGAPHGELRHHAVDEINKAIDEVKHAAWDDGRNTKFAPPDRGVTQGWAPIHQATHWLMDAKGHVAEGVDNAQNAGLRERIIFHIDDAVHTLMDLQRLGVE